MGRMHAAFSQTDHRPWPVPERHWVMQQQWKDLLFLHWEVSAAALQAALPAGLEVDTHDGRAWLGVVPFAMEGVRPRGIPRLGAWTDFPEINVRTYVKKDGKPGVWFYSLDVTNPLAVWAARRFFHLPYFRAAMNVRREGDAVRYRSEREHYRFDATYRPVGEASFPPGSFEVWATERYCLYAEDGEGRILRGEVQHPRWPLETAGIELRENTMLADFEVGRMHPAVLFSRHLDVVVWSPNPA